MGNGWQLNVPINQNYINFEIDVEENYFACGVKLKSYLAAFINPTYMI